MVAATGRSPVGELGVRSLDEVAQLGLRVIGGIGEGVVRGQDGEAAPLLILQLEVDRAVVDRTTSGLLKLVCDKRGHVLGAHALCANASTLIETLVLARKKKLTIAQLAQLVSPYPSLADALQKAASLYYQDVAKGWLGSVGKWIAQRSQ